LLVAHAGPALADAASLLGATALDLALHGGEDYALLATSAQPIPGFSRIGEIAAGSGLALRDGAGENELAPAGFDHFAQSP
jgi:thiamine-monophosphate kinase